MSFLARLSLANRSLVGLITFAIIGLGGMIIPGLRQQLLPSSAPAMAVILAPYPGATPETVSTQVTEVIEAGVRGTEGLHAITSESADSIASIRIEFKNGTDMDRAVRNLRETINGLQSRLPQAVKPEVSTGSTDQIPVLTLAALSSGDDRQLADRLTALTVPELKKIEGVRDVTLNGARRERVEVTVDYERLANAGVSPAAVVTALQQAGTTTPTGAVTDAQRTISVQVGSQLESIQALRNLNVTATVDGGVSRPVRLTTVATVAPVLDEQAYIVRTNGKPSLELSVSAAEDANSVQISKDIRGKLAQFSQTAGTQFVVVSDVGPPIEDAISGMSKEGILGLAFAMLVIVVFLRSARSTLVVGMSIPLSLLVTLMVLGNGDYSLNLITLSGLTIAVGRVVDDSIVVLENIKRHLGYGEDKKTAVLSAVREVSAAVTASTLTTVAVFLPIAFVGGFTGQILGPFGITVSVALIASLFVSLTVIPVLAYWFLKPSRHNPTTGTRRRVDREQRGWLQRIYVPVVRFAISRKLVTLFIALVIFGGTVGLAAKLKTSFLDNSDNTLTVSQTMPPGTSLRARDQAAGQIERLLPDFRDVTTYQVAVGSDANYFNTSTEQTTFKLTLRKEAKPKTLQDQLSSRIKGRTDVGEVTFGSQAGGAADDKISVVVQAPTPEALRTATEQVRRTVTETPDLSQVTTDLAKNTQRVQVDVNQSAAGLGVTQQAVSQMTAQATGGFPITEVSIGGKQQQIVLRSAIAPRDMAALRAIPIATSAGTITLSRVAQVRMVERPAKLNRTDSQRSATITAKPDGKDLGAVTGQLTDKLKALRLAVGATYKIGGASAEQDTAFRDLGTAMVAAIILVFVIMVAAFRSVVQPLILLISIPFAATGALGMLLATDTPLGLAAMIGLLMLVGIVVTNAIVLIDLINQYREKGMSVRDAVIEGARHRLRPILMTAAATIFALIPMAAGLGAPNPFIGRPLGLVVIGGLVSSTLLTLVLVPTLYTMVEGVKERSGRKRAESRAATREAPPTAKRPREYQRTPAEPVWPTRDIP